MRMLNH